MKFFSVFAACFLSACAFGLDGECPEGDAEALFQRIDRNLIDAFEKVVGKNPEKREMLQVLIRRHDSMASTGFATAGDPLAKALRAGVKELIRVSPVFISSVDFLSFESNGKMVRRVIEQAGAQRMAVMKSDYSSACPALSQRDGIPEFWEDMKRSFFLNNSISAEEAARRVAVDEAAFDLMVGYLLELEGNKVQVPGDLVARTPRQRILAQTALLVAVAKSLDEVSPHREQLPSDQRKLLEEAEKLQQHLQLDLSFLGRAMADFEKAQIDRIACAVGHASFDWIREKRRSVRRKVLDKR